MLTLKKANSMLYRVCVLMQFNIVALGVSIGVCMTQRYALSTVIDACSCKLEFSPLF